MGGLNRSNEWGSRKRVSMSATTFGNCVVPLLSQWAFTAQATGALAQC